MVSSPVGFGRVKDTNRKEHNPVSDVQIQITENGPYKVTGDIELLDAAGHPVPTQGGAAFLCRCGGSTNKPFCDGTHSKIGFQGATAAVEAAES
jgi:CDGSH-type Zn-finger protein